MNATNPWPTFSRANAITAMINITSIMVIAFYLGVKRFCMQGNRVDTCCELGSGGSRPQTVAFITCKVNLPRKVSKFCPCDDYNVL